MDIEELKNELKELKAMAYDLSVEYTKMTKKISDVEKRIKELKPSNEKTSINQENIEIPQVDNVSQDIVNIPEIEKTIVPAETIDETVQVEDVQPTVGSIQEEVVPGPRVLDQSPLTPIGVEMPNSKENKVYMKVDDNDPKALMTTTMQSGKLRKSLETNRDIKLESDLSATNQEQQIELPKIEEGAVTTPLIQSEERTSEDIQKQINAMVERLPNAQNEEEANRINAEISKLNEEYKVLTKAA